MAFVHLYIIIEKCFVNRDHSDIELTLGYLASRDFPAGNFSRYVKFLKNSKVFNITTGPVWSKGLI